MAWTDYSTTAPDSWASTIGSSVTDTDIVIDVTVAPEGPSVACSTAHVIIEHASLDRVYNIPGFDSGHQPVSVPSPISNNIDEGGGGGSSRPTSGFLYPRGQG